MPTDEFPDPSTNRIKIVTENPVTGSGDVPTIKPNPNEEPK